MPPVPGPYDSLEEYTDALAQFVSANLFRQITGGIHVNDSLIKNAWAALPDEWTLWWSAFPDHRLSQRDLIDSIDESIDEPVPQTIGSSAQPASLRDWLHTVRNLSLSRVQHSSCISPPLPNVLETAFNTKKAAEVSTAAAYIVDKCRARAITRIVDVGSGQGYLPITLAHLNPDLRILAIDGSPSQVAGSKALASSLGIPENRLNHLVHHVDGNLALMPEIVSWAQGEPCMLIGLHACGSLSEHMIRLFVSLSCIVEIAVVGCCYNHIQPHSEECKDGFPISSRLRGLEVELSPTALMTGCQAPNNWSTSMGTPKGGSNSTKRHFYRALLEKVFHDHSIDWKAGGYPTWGIRKTDMVSFTAFASRAMEHLQINAAEVSSEMLQKYEIDYQDSEGHVAMLWTLSILCCKVVESVIAMDRYWFLVERGASNVDVLPIFDYRISPRNLMIVASKMDDRIDAQYSG